MFNTVVTLVFSAMVASLINNQNFIAQLHTRKVNPSVWSKPLVSEFAISGSYMPRQPSRKLSVCMPGSLSAVITVISQKLTRLNQCRLCVPIYL